jgi:nitroreductase
MTAFDDLVRTRRSVRAYKPDPVDPAIIRACFETAQLAPSNCNVQPWRAWVATGAARDRLSARLTSAMIAAENPGMEDMIQDFKGDYRDRQIACAVEMYGHMGVGRGDHAGRFKAHLRNYELFDAPHVAMIGMDRSFGLGVAIDVGIWLDTLMLAFTERGIATCPMASLRSHPGIVRAELGIPEEIRILCGLTFGYEAPEAPVNRTKQPRDPIDRNVVFLDD